MSESLVFAAILLGGLGFWLMWSREQLPRFRKKPVLAGSEREFFYRLCAALPECTVFAQVAASALIEPAGAGRLRRNGTARLQGRRVGVAVFDDEMRLIAVVELDYRARTARKDALIDTCFASAGIRVVRFQANRLPSEAKIRSAIYARAKPKANAAGVFGEIDSIEFKRPKTPWRDTLNVHI